MFMEERVHPIPFRTRQLSSPSSMILRTLTWESRTTPRLYFQRAVLSRTALCFARSPSPSRPPPPPRVSSSPRFFFLRLYPPGSLHNWLIRFFFFFFFFFFTFFPQASLICQAKALEGLCLRERGGHGIVSLIGKCSPRYPS